MKYASIKVIEAVELENALKFQYNAEFNIYELFFAYKNKEELALEPLNYSDYNDKPDFTSDADTIEELKRRVVCGYLRDCFPEDDWVIIDYI